MFDDIFSPITNAIGTVLGTVVGVSAAVIAGTLGLSIDVVNAALRAGCTTYTEIKNFAEDNF